jgi:hypothetical protein
MKKFLSLLVCASFIVTLAAPPAYPQPQSQPLMGRDLASLPKPGGMVVLSNAVKSPVLRGIKVFTNDPLNFDFILDPGDKDRRDILTGKMDPKIQAELKETSNRLFKYFLTALTVPDNEIWVNLSPYEKDRIIPKNFGRTEMGRDLLGQDYLLKQITASLMFPEGEAGRRFWGRVYQEAQKKFGTTHIPVDTFNKVWVMPDKAVIYEKISGHQATAFVVDSRLKIMLESDYIAAKKHGEAAAVGAVQREPLTDAQKLSRNVAREVIIPILEKEVNEGENFAPLRQVYNSILLALWYKERMKGSILSSAYVNRGKIAGVNVADQAIAQKIWRRYVQAYKKGVFNLIEEEKDAATQQIIPRKYFAGGFTIKDLAMTVTSDPSVFTRRTFLGTGLAALAGLGLVEVLGGCGVTPSGVWNFSHINSINISPTLASNYWGYNVGTSGGALTVQILYNTPQQQNTVYILNRNGTIVSPDHGTNKTYMYNTPQGENILLNVIDILNFVKSLSAGNASELDGAIQKIQASLPAPLIDVSITKVFNYQYTQEEYSITPQTDSNGDVNLRLSDQIPDQTLGLGIPSETGTDNINMSTQVVTSYFSWLYPESETFQPNTDEWANVLYWILLDLQGALEVEQAAQPGGNTAAITQLEQWIATISGWYNNYFNPKAKNTFEKNAKSVRPIDLRRIDLAAKRQGQGPDRAMAVTRRTFIAQSLAFLALSRSTLLIGQYSPKNAKPFAYEKAIIGTGAPHHQKVVVFGSNHPDVFSVSRMRQLMENVSRFKNPQSAKNLKDTIASKREFLTQYRAFIRNFEQTVQENPDIKAFGNEDMVFDEQQRPEKLNMDNVRKIKTVVRNAVASLFEGDRSVDIEKMTDDVLLYTLPPQQYLALTDKRIAEMTPVGIEDGVLLKEQFKNVQAHYQDSVLLSSAADRGFISQEDFQFLLDLYTFQTINNSRRARIEGIKNRAGDSYRPLLDAYIRNYDEYIDLIQKRSAAMARNIHQYGNNMIVPVGDFHFQTLVKTLRSMPSTKAGKAGKAGKAAPSKGDQAMKGGIDLTRNSTPLDLRHTGNAAHFIIDPAQIERLNMAPGLTPQVFAVDPLQSLPEFLGMSREEAGQMAA